MFNSKVIVVFLLFTSTLFASTPTAFKETRYSYALDKNISFEGFISFGENNIVIEYTKPEPKVLTYFEEKLSIQDPNGFTMVDMQKAPSMHYFFMIIKAIHDNNTVLLNSFFDQSGEPNYTHLTPKGISAEVLEEVTIEKKGTALKSLHVKIKNGDRILIEIVE